MKTKLASVLCLAVLVASFTCGSSFVYADAPEAASSAMQVLVPDADANGAEADKLPRVSNGDGAENNCTGDAQTAEAGQPPSAVSEIEPSTIEPSTVEASPAPAIQSADAIIVEVTQTVTVVVPGEDAADSEETAVTGSIPEPAATEPAAVVEAAAATDASPAAATEASDAVAVEVVQTVTIAAPGQTAGDDAEPAVAESISEPSATEPALTRDAELP
jgi:hypothetical protein